MRKRLQKKLHVGPFREFGFELKAKLREDVNFESVLDEFVDFIEANGLSFGGSCGDDELTGFIDLGKADIADTASTAEDKKEIVLEWFKNKSEILSLTVDKTVDAWK